MNWTGIATTTTALVCSMLLSGCAHDRAKAQFGDAVRHTTAQQIHDLDAAYNPDPNPVTGGDADKLNTALETWRLSLPAAAPGAPVIGVPGANR